jgi:hypothetical protein
VCVCVFIYIYIYIYIGHCRFRLLRYNTFVVNCEVVATIECFSHASHLNFGPCMDSWQRRIISRKIGEENVKFTSPTQQSHNNPSHESGPHTLGPTLMWGIVVWLLWWCCVWIKSQLGNDILPLRPKENTCSRRKFVGGGFFVKHAWIMFPTQKLLASSLAVWWMYVMADYFYFYFF